ncbi:phosphatidylinositol transfer protein SFH5 [Apiospora arundinis]|uniref:Phosphatidylinositol transfer protein SFH5 n=1 Tax=Apiospora arundinis TaxID=335852 RepID=A0ABR2HNS1_9PEZI
MADPETKPAAEPNATPAKVDDIVKDEQAAVKAEEPATADAPIKVDPPAEPSTKTETETETETDKPVTEASAALANLDIAENPAKVEDPATAEVGTAAAKTEEPTKQETAASAAKPATTDKETEAAATETAQKETPVAAADTTSTEQPKANASIQELYAAAKANGHPEIWGVVLQDPEHHVPSQIIFQKYLNANDGDLPKAKDQLVKTLEWRAQTNALESIKKAWSKDKFDGLGYVTTFGDFSQGAEGKEVFTWNVYGIVKDMNVTFGDRDEFINWRVALMELAMKELDISSATQPITATWDPYKIYQVHDYKSVSFLRQNPKVKAAVSETVKVFGQNYPELLKQKFFVNVPAIMGWLYAVVKLFVADRTAKKFHPMGNGANMSAEFADSKVPALGELLPKEYGGKGDDLKIQGKQTLLE